MKRDEIFPLTFGCCLLLFFFCCSLLWSISSLPPISPFCLFLSLRVFLHPPPSFLRSPRPASLSALSAVCNKHQQVGLIAARRTGRLTGGKAMGAIADKAKEKKK
jgi:hypothetical protein